MLPLGRSCDAGTLCKILSRTGIFGLSKGKLVDKKFGDFLNLFGVSVILIGRRNGTYESKVKKWFTKKEQR